MSTRHLHLTELQELARLALGHGPDAGETGLTLGMETLLHLKACARCRQLLAATSVALDAAAEEAVSPDELAPGWKPGSGPEPVGDLEDFLPDYVVVDLEPCEIERNSLAEPSIRLAATRSRIASIGPARDRARSYRSTDARLTIDVREDSRDDTCYVYLLPRPDLDREAVRLYVPPGLVRPWPESGHFRYPRYTYDAVDWSELKLLYPRRPEV